MLIFDCVEGCGLRFGLDIGVGSSPRFLVAGSGADRDVDSLVFDGGRRRRGCRLRINYQIAAATIKSIRAD